jgi:hypothetical protein
MVKLVWCLVTVSLYDTYMISTTKYTVSQQSQQSRKVIPSTPAHPHPHPHVRDCQPSSSLTFTNNFPAALLCSVIPFHFLTTFAANSCRLATCFLNTALMRAFARFFTALSCSRTACKALLIWALALSRTARRLRACSRMAALMMALARWWTALARGRTWFLCFEAGVDCHFAQFVDI